MMPPTDAASRIDRNRKILDQMPDNHLARFALATALFDAGLTDEAEAEFRQCLKLQADWMAVAISLGRCLVMTGKHAEARGVLASAREMELRQGHSSPLEEIADLKSRLA